MHYETVQTKCVSCCVFINFIIICFWLTPLSLSVHRTVHISERFSPGGAAALLSTWRPFSKLRSKRKKMAAEL